MKKEVLMGSSKNSVRAEIEALRHQLMGLEEAAKGKRDLTGKIRVILNQLDVAAEYVSNQEQEIHSLRSTKVVMDRLIQVFGRFQGNRDETEFLKEVLKLAAELVCADTGFILRVEPDGSLKEIESFGDGDLTYSRSLAQQVLESGEHLILKNIEGEGLGNSISKYGIVGTAVFPIYREGRLEGIMYLDSRHPERDFSSETETHLKVLLSLAEYILGLCHRIAVLRHTATREDLRFGDAIGVSSLFRETIDKAKKYALSDHPILLIGETGTGKELFATAIHKHSKRSAGEFNAVNLCESNNQLVQSDLFGHKKGAFTGADKDREGLIAASSGGTLFLDEIADLPKEMQVILLRFLDNQSYRRVGEDETRVGNVRIIAATNRELEIDIREGKFRADLYHRLLVCKIEIPPLRMRREDINYLWNHFLDLANSQYDSQVLTSPEAFFSLNSYAWPGNARELRHMVDRLVLDKAPDGVIQQTDLVFIKKVFCADETPVKLDELRKQQVKAVLEQVGGNRTKASSMLGITPRTLYNWLKDWEKVD